MSRLWRRDKERNRRVRQAREQLAIVRVAPGIQGGLDTASKDPAQLLSLANRLDALLRRQDRLQRVIERALEPSSYGSR